ncbi:MAG: hypothetical protein F4139_15190 [Gemmatimonadetes bacterium]|nr:hypothetical protein [Gemmatimonadota bacterium]MYH54262.1 hypothetical protein [Gemmatimonadota bacterium]MYK65724.1 hypothetical protein [Gemmatimonadota bacterium]
MDRYRFVIFTLAAPAAILCTSACDDRGTGPPTPDDSPDRAALMRLYDLTYGPGWTNNDGWGTDAPLGTWYGVETDGSGRVIGLDLSGTYDTGIGDWRRNGLIGPIPPELGDLSQLETLQLEGNELKGPIPPELGNLSRLTQLHLGDNSLIGPIPPELGNLTQLTDLELLDNELTEPIPPELANLSGLTLLNLSQNELAGPIPPGLGLLSSLETLALYSNNLTGEIPVELAGLANLEILSIGSNDLAGAVPPWLGDLANLDWLSLSYSNLTGTIPPELGNLRNLTGLFLQGNDLEGTIPAELGSLPAVEWLYLATNTLTGSIPPELGNLANLTILWLSDNELSGPIPPQLGNLRNATYLGLTGNNLTGSIPPELGGLASMERLYLNRNELEGPVPPEFGAMSDLRILSLTDNSALDGPLPAELAALHRLDEFLAGGTGLCVPDDPAFTAWLEGIHKRRVAACSGVNQQAYLIQAVQSRAFPVPLVAGKEALLRVFVTAPNPTSAQIPAVRARFFHDGMETRVEDIPGRALSIPTEVDESSLLNSSNAVISGDLVQPGLEMVIEIDPDGTLDPELGIAKRIPETGRMTIEVGAMPVFDLTLVPLVWEWDPDYEIVGTVGAMAADPENHEMLWDTRTLLPVGEIDAKAHATVMSSSNDAFVLLRETRAIRVMEGGTGHYMGMMSPPVTEAGGVAYRPGRSSFSQPYADIVAHEFGHNFSLRHAPCGGAGGPDSSFPDADGSIGAWGYDARGSGRLVAPTLPDIMSYCEPGWIGEFHFTNALRFRLSEADSAALPMVSPSGRALLLWGGIDAGGVPFLEPAFVVDAPAALPRAGGDFRLAGMTDGGAELFSFSFAMPEVADGDGSSSFVYVLPWLDEWEETPAAITLTGPGGSVALDTGSDLAMALLHDSQTGEVRGILRDLPATVLTRADAVAALSPAAGLKVLFSRGIPAAESWQR